MRVALLVLAVTVLGAQESLPRGYGDLIDTFRSDVRSQESKVSRQEAGAKGTGERIAQGLRERGLSPELVVVAVATLPIVELRGAVPIGINLFRMAWWKAVLLSVFGNMIPIFLVLLFLDRLTGWLGRLPVFERLFDWLFKRTRRKSGLIERYEFLGLAVFVGIPLPMTGAWTGSVAAVLVGMAYWRAMLAIFLGVLMAAAIVTTLSLLGLWGALLAGVALAAIVVRAVFRSRKR